MADSNQARGSARATASKSTRKAGAASAKSASKDRKPASAKTAPAAAAKPARPAAAQPSASPRVAATLPTAERNRMIAEAAYYRAQQRGFAPGDPHRDWLEAEAEIDAMLLRRLADD